MVCITKATRLPREFFARHTLAVARDLLGTRLVRLLDGQRLSGRIVECEAYVGQDDSACHASHGRTRRNAVMFGPPGHAYVYFTYGMHWMLNVVTEPEGFPAAVLVRALEPLEGVETMYNLREARGKPRREADLTNGPAKLTQALAINGAFNGADLVLGNTLWLERGQPVPEVSVHRGPRVGIRYAAEKDRHLPWRFWIEGNPHVSRRVRSLLFAHPPRLVWPPHLWYTLATRGEEHLYADRERPAGRRRRSRAACSERGCRSRRRHQHLDPFSRPPDARTFWG